MKIGYVRVSTGDQNTDLQVDALKKRVAIRYSVIRPAEPRQIVQG